MEQPSGTVTFLFTDVEGSTQLWERYPEAMRTALARHDAILRKEIERRGGYVVKLRGDGFHAAFATASDALAAALAAQRALHAEAWGDVNIKARMALHSGAGEERAGDYFGTVTNRAARLLSAGHGGQILLSLATRELVCDQLPDQVGLRDLGQHRLKDLSRPERIFQVVAPDLPAFFGPLKTLDCRPNNLPAQTTSFIGREGELAAVREELSRPEVRLLTLTGPGGSGKTRLGLQVAAEVLDDFEHGVYFVALAPISDPALVVPTIAQTLVIPTGAQMQQDRQVEGQSLLEILKDYLRNKQMLLVLDNFEQVIRAAPVLIELLTCAPRLKILVTSRASLRVYGEHDCAVPPLTSPGPQEVPSLERLKQYTAVQLFAERARAVQADYAITDDTAPAVAEVCHRLDGSPLAIELAAAWVRMLTPAEIATEIAQGLDFLETDMRDVPERQRSVRAVFDHSWNLLTEREREVFQGLSVFRGGFTREAACHVTDASLRELMALVHKSLLRRTTTGRYEVHELLRQYAAERLDRSLVARDTARDGHCAYYALALQGWAVDLCGARQEAALAEMDAEIENARAAWNWAAERRQIERLEQALVGLCRFYRCRGRHQEGEAACRLAEEEIGAAITDDESLLLAQVLSIRAFFNWKLGRTEFAGQQLRKSLALLGRSESDDQCVRLAKAYALLEVGHVASGTDREESRGWYEQSLDLFRELGDRYGTALTLYALGEVTRQLGNYEDAQRFHEEGLATREALGDQRGIADSLGGLSSIAAYQGRFEEGERLIRQSIAIRQEIGDRAGSADGLSDLGVTLTVLGKYVESHTALEESIAIYTDLGVRNGLANAHGRLALTKWNLARYKQARAQAEMCISLSRKTGHKFGIAWGLGVLGGLALAEGAYTDAQSLFQTAVTIHREIGQRDELGWVLAGLGCAKLGLGKIPQARQCFYEALHTATEIRSFVTLFFVFPGVILLRIVQGEQERAVELYALISRYPLVAKSHFVEDFVGRNISLAAASLPADVVATAQARGRVRDLWDTAVELIAEFESDKAPQPLVKEQVSGLDGLEESITSTHQLTAPVALHMVADRFEISNLEKDLLGGGEMGNVYRGTDTQTGQTVAIKVLRPEILASQPDMVVRFVREGEALSQLDHPNIVKMVAAIEEQGQYYIIEEYVAGGSLRDLLEARGPLPITRVVEITLELADALARAHHLGIIHRDLKPANVLLAADGTPRLTDFGHAHVIASPRLTRTGTLVGSVGYLSPEACNGEPLDSKADIWALGVMLYELLTGELPFTGETLIAAITAILTQPVPDLASLRPDLPEALADLIGSMLEKDPGKRIASARLVGAELEAILARVREQ